MGRGFPLRAGWWAEELPSAKSYATAVHLLLPAGHTSLVSGADARIQAVARGYLDACSNNHGDALARSLGRAGDV